MYCPDVVQILRPNEVFVFGSNDHGFHGAGSAGYAMRGKAENTWRKDPDFLVAMNSPVGSPERIGRWAVFGVGHGYQEGREGSSYAIATVTSPGKRRSKTPREILDQFLELSYFAEQNTEKTFLVVVSGGGYNGYPISEMKEIYRAWCDYRRPPENIRLKKEYEFRDGNKELL